MAAIFVSLLVYFLFFVYHWEESKSPTVMCYLLCVGV